jgi:uncharacterized RDD family membrane protein YckC
MTARAVVATPAARAEGDYAGLVTRTLAFAADVVVIDLAALLVGGVVAIAASFFDLPQDLRTVLAAAGVVAGALWAVGYFVAFWSTSGQTPGDRLMRIRVQDERTGRPLPVSRALGRLVALFLGVLLLFVGVLWILVDDRRRGLHDRLAGTVVVHAEDRPAGRSAP